MKLYHYTKAEKFESIWKSQSLSFSVPKETNDLFERKKLMTVSCVEGNNRWIDLSVYSDIIGGYKQVSFSQDYEDGLRGCYSPMMWAHYGENTGGICLEFDFDKLLKANRDIQSNMYHSQVVYTNELPVFELCTSDLHNKDTIKRFIIKNIEGLFFIKHIHWKPENEYRFVSEKCDNLSIGNAVTAIYVPHEDCLAYRTVDKLVNGEVKIRVLIQSVLKGNRSISCYLPLKQWK